MATEMADFTATGTPVSQVAAPTIAETSDDAGQRFGARRLIIFLGLSLLLAGGITVAIVLWAREAGLGLDTAIGSVGWKVLAAAVALHLGAHMAWAARLWTVSHGTGRGITYSFAFRLVTAGVFGAAITPGRAGGEGLRYLMLRRHHPEPDHAMRFLVADRTLDLCFFILAGIPAAIALPVLLGGDVAYRGAALVWGVVLALLFGILVLLIAGLEHVPVAAFVDDLADGLLGRGVGE